MTTILTKTCWNCDYFQTSNPTANPSGWCRRYAPRGMDEKTIAVREYYDQFPAVKDGSLEWCNDWKPNANPDTIPSVP
jgi:hypothetical protein